MSEVYIIGAYRTAVAPSGGIFRNLNFDDLSVSPIQKLLSQYLTTPLAVDELIVSNALGAGGNPARRIAIASGLPDSIAGLTIDRQCAGGIDAINLGRHLILSGGAEVVIAGGVESHSLRPQRFFRNSFNATANFSESAPFLPNSSAKLTIHQMAEKLANEESINRKQQDLWAISSHQKAWLNKQELALEIVSPQNLINANLAKYDLYPRALKLSTCARAKILSGSITTANTAVSADAAGFVLMVSTKTYKKIKPKFALAICSGKTVGADPLNPALAAVEAVKAIIADGQYDIYKIGAIELMEAYAVQAIACMQKLNLPIDKINIKGGGLARGHPIGASGAILIVRLFYELQSAINNNKIQNQSLQGLAAIASVGGIGSAMLVETRQKS